jgi:hypothetical protein
MAQWESIHQTITLPTKVLPPLTQVSRKQSASQQHGISKKEKTELWKSFWFITIGAFVTSGFVIVLCNVVPDIPLLFRMLLLGSPCYLCWAALARKLEPYTQYTGISYPSTYIVLALACYLLFVPGFLWMFISFMMRVDRIPINQTN